MKTTYVQLLSVLLIGILLFSLCACGSPTETTKESSGGDLSFEPPSDYDILYYNSYEELQAMWTGKDVSALQESFRCKEKSVADFNALIATSDQAPIPKLNGEEFTFLNHEGFSNIIIFSAELYGRPWLWYYYTYKGEYMRVHITPVSLFGEEVANNADDIWELLDIVAPNGPSADNYDKKPELIEAYNCITNGKIKVGGKNTACVIYDFKDYLDRVSFLYDGYFVSVNGDLSLFDEAFFNGFSLD